MGSPVVLTPQAEQDLREIVEFIARDNPARARSYGHRLLDKAFSLGTLTERGRMVPETGDAAVREVIVGSYRIIYEVLADPTTVFVLRFWHGARGAPELPNG